MTEKPWLTRKRGIGHALPLFERFWEKVDVRGPDECWPWRAARDSSGYGMLYDARVKRNRRASAVALETKGVILAPREEARHACDNPPCCNPGHLSPGTRQDNVNDRVARGRSGSCPMPGELNPQAKLTVGKVIAIRWLGEQGCGYRHIAWAFGVSEGLIYQIMRRRVWRHI